MARKSNPDLLSNLIPKHVLFRVDLVSLAICKGSLLYHGTSVSFNMVMTKLQSAAHLKVTTLGDVTKL